MFLATTRAHAKELIWEKLKEVSDRASIGARFMETDLKMVLHKNGSQIRLVGCSTTRHFHERESATARKIRPDHLVFFRDEEQAVEMGFSAGR